MEQFTNLVKPTDEADALPLPHEVASRHLLEGVSLIRAWREYLGRSQGELAEDLGVTQSQIGQWEAPEGHLRDFTLKRIAVSLGLDVSQLILADEEGPA